MPRLANDQHETFAQNIAKGMSQVDAYEAAGYKRSEAHASRLARKSPVRARIGELIDKAAQIAISERAEADLAAEGAVDKAVVTRVWLINRQLSILDQAEADKDWGPANTAIKQAAQLAGQWEDRSKVEHSGGPITVEILRFSDTDTASS